jgi:hypothetical protein
MNTIGAVFLAVLGLLGAYLFLMVHGQHTDQVKQQDLEHKIQIERFDRDFEKAWNGQKLSDSDREKRLLDLELQERETKEKAALNAVDRKAQEQDLRRTLDQLSGKKGSP